MGRGRSGKGAALTGAALVSLANAPINEAKTGASFRSLNQYLKENISRNLQLSKAMEDNLMSTRPVKMTDEWTTGFPGDKAKIKVITDVSSGRPEYTVRQRNKILLRTQSKDQAANKVAQFYLERQAEMRKSRR